MTSPYLDIRQQFFQNYFEQALRFEDYLQTGTPEQHSRWSESLARVSITPVQIELLSSFSRKMPLLVLSGIWCGDCSRQGPILHAFQLVQHLLDVRFIESKQVPELQDELRINGAQKVPVVVALSEDFYEVARFGDRHLSIYRRKAISELGAACDPGILPPSSQEMEEETQEWLSFLERVYLLLRLSPALRRRYND